MADVYKDQCNACKKFGEEGKIRLVSLSEYEYQDKVLEDLKNSSY
jgi:hypothetical protein